MIEWSWIVPILSSDVTLIANSSCVDDYPEENKSQDSKNFDDREDELRLTIAFDAEEIDGDDDDKEYRYPGGAIDVSAAWPEVECERRGDDLKPVGSQAIGGHS